MLENDFRIKIIIVGLFLIALTVGYLIISPRFSAKQPNQNQEVVSFSPTPTPTTLGQTNIALSPTTSPVIVTQSPTPTPSQASVSNPTQAPQTNNTNRVFPPDTLPSTGAETLILGLFGLSLIVIGFSLRKYPN